MSELEQTLMTYSAPKGDDWNNAAILDDPAWLAVVSAAQRAKQELLSVVSNKSERQTLLGER